MNILILGGNGFIGSAIAQRAVADGHSVTCLGRNIRHTQNRMPECTWIKGDLRGLQKPENWTALLEGRNAVINAAGALQDGLNDNLSMVQTGAMRALYEAAFIAGLCRIIQISANLGEPGSSAFLETKRLADDALRYSGLEHVILRPTLVVGRNAHGGTALVRALAGFPGFLPITFANSKIQTTDLDDLCEITLLAATGKIGNRSDVVVTSKTIQTLESVVLAHRGWLGVSGSRVLRLPDELASLCAKMADFAGWLGWRSPLRSTALKALASGVTGDTAAQTLETRSLEETLVANPAGIQDIWFSRLFLLKPLVIITLSLFWIASGLIAFWNFDQASNLLVDAGYSESGANLVTGLTSLADIILGTAVLFRGTARWAFLGMILLSITYLGAGTLLEPSLWLDPLGAYVKVIPSIILAMVGLAILDER